MTERQRDGEAPDVDKDALPDLEKETVRDLHPRQPRQVMGQSKSGYTVSQNSI